MTTLRGKSSVGLNRVVWNMRRKLTQEEIEKMKSSGQYRRRSGELVKPGEYVVILKAGGRTLQRIATVREMPGE
jgi:hypothetical protein